MCVCVCVCVYLCVCVHRAHYELFIRALDAPNVRNPGAVCLVHPTVGPTQVRLHTWHTYRHTQQVMDASWMVAGMRVQGYSVRAPRHITATHSCSVRLINEPTDGERGQMRAQPHICRRRASQHATRRPVLALRCK